MTILLDADATSAANLHAVTGHETTCVDNPVRAQQLLDTGQHDLLVVGPDIDAGTAFDFATAQRAAGTDVGVVLVRRRLSSNLLREAMVAGVREVVPSDDLTVLADAVQRSRRLSAQLRQSHAHAAGLDVSVSRAGHVVTVFAAKGGCGKTTVATNLATSLAQAGRRTCLVDLDLAFGDVAIAMQLNPSRTIADALGLSSLDETAVKSLVTPHPSGVDAILAPVTPGTAEAIPAALIGDLLSVLTTMYDVVVIDSPPAFTDHVLAAFDRTDHFVLLATLDIPALKNLKLTLETLDMLSYPRERRRVVLNRSDAKVGLTVADVERTLGWPIAIQIPSSRVVPASINRGVPIVLDQPTHAVSVALRRLALSLVPESSSKPARPGSFRSIRLRRKAEASA